MAAEGIPILGRSPSPPPPFTVHYCPVTHRNVLSIPKVFWKKYVKKHDHKLKLILEVSGVEWELTVSTVGNRIRASGGWKDFVKGNRLVVGNVLKFELVNKGKTHFVVSIIE